MTGRDLMSYDDLYVKSNDLSDLDAPTVIALAHNEMYFLPAWLDHYRRLGARRFIILDDASTDGTLDYLRAQPDVMVMGSGRRFGDRVPLRDRRDPSGQTVAERRMDHVWRMLLPERFSMNRWFVLADLDEFLMLPEGSDLGALTSALEDAAFDAVRGTMLDVYPPDIAALRRRAQVEHLDLPGEWFFDAQPHRLAVATGDDYPIYHGSRARLVHHFLTLPAMRPAARLLEGTRLRLKAGLGRFGYPRINEIRKVPLMRWRPGASMPSAHRSSLLVSPRRQLPILHLKFTGDTYRRAQVAMRDQSHFRGSVEYEQLVRLLAAMEVRGASFLYPHSAPIGEADAFRRAGLLAGF